MKPNPHYLSLAAALLFVPAVLAQDEKAPGKASDAVGTLPADTTTRGTPSKVEARDTAKDPGKASDGVHPAKAGGDSFSGRVTAVNKEAKTVTIEDKTMGSHTLHIGDSTSLKKGSEEATWSDLKVGEEVHGSCTKQGEMFHAQTLKIGKKS